MYKPGLAGGQLVLPGVDAPAQMGLDGLAYALPEPATDLADDGKSAVLTGDRQLWLEGVEVGTLLWRMEQAGRHRARAARSRAMARDAVAQLQEFEVDASLAEEERDQLVDELTKQARKGQLTAEWHDVRAEGVMARFDSIRECGTESIVRTCDGCGSRHSVTELGCGDWKGCLKCRDKRKRKYQRRFSVGRRRAVSRYRLAMKGGYRWSEKLQTLTVAHSGDVVADLAELRRALPFYLRQLKSHLILDRRVPAYMLDHMPWVSVVECTCGDDYEGHPHIHLWLLTPYVHHELLRLFWWKALRARYQAAVPTKPLEEVLARGGDERRRKQLRAWLRTRRGRNGRPLAEVPWPVLDVRAGYNCGKELIKYLVKDGDRKSGELRLMDPDLFSRIYIAYAGRRSIQACSGFWMPDKPLVQHCEWCGCCDIRSEIAQTLEVGEGGDGRDRGPPGSGGGVRASCDSG